jgi:hypothetical protein
MSPYLLSFYSSHLEPRFHPPHLVTIIITANAAKNNPNAILLATTFRLLHSTNLTVLSPAKVSQSRNSNGDTTIKL